MNQLINRYPVLTFFVLTTALGWIAVMVGIAVMPIDAEHEMTPLHGILVFLVASPSVVAIIIIVTTGPKRLVRESRQAQAT